MIDNAETQSSGEGLAKVITDSDGIRMTIDAGC